MLMQKFGVTNKEHYGMFWYFLEWSIILLLEHSLFPAAQRGKSFKYRHVNYIKVESILKYMWIWSIRLENPRVSC